MNIKGLALTLFNLSSCYCFALLGSQTHRFVGQFRYRLSSPSCTQTDNDTTSDDFAEEKAAFSERQALKLSLLLLGKDTRRGFVSNQVQRNEVSEIIAQLASLNPVDEPAASFYKDKSSVASDVSITGKWTLVYTDAPDIISLDVASSSFVGLPAPPAAAKLGRIGQECDAIQSTIANVIEWKAPDWVENLVSNSSLASPESSNEKVEDKQARVLQKVICEAMASPDKPSIVDLNLVGFELKGISAVENIANESVSGFLPKISSISSFLNDGPASFLSKNPLKLRGPLKAPFGKFEVMYLDEDLRIIKTGQGYYAVNMREGDPWF